MIASGKLPLRSVMPYFPNLPQNNFQVINPNPRVLILPSPPSKFPYQSQPHMLPTPPTTNINTNYQIKRGLGNLK